MFEANIQGFDEQLELQLGQPDKRPQVHQATSTTFSDNMSLPVHRWFRFSAGFSATWAESVIAESGCQKIVRVLDPFAGSGTTLLAAENVGVESYGLEAHPFLCRIARAKLARRTDPGAYRDCVRRLLSHASHLTPSIAEYPILIHKCYDGESLARLDVLRRASAHVSDGSPASELAWLTLVGILRKVSRANTAQWQYVLPTKSKKRPEEPFSAFQHLAEIVYHDMCISNRVVGPSPHFDQNDARICGSVPDGCVNLVITSPPYPNNFDYADATRLEMSFFQEVSNWADLQNTVRHHLIRSCSQHVPENSLQLDEILSRPELEPIRSEIAEVCHELARVRLDHGGRKTYHLMVACYFLDLAQVWGALRRVCASPSRLCFVIGDSAPYGVYVPVAEWLAKLALASGFTTHRFERTRARNVKWKNRKHRVPLCEGRLWIEG